jgi:hypothetical protein
MACTLTNSTSNDNLIILVCSALSFIGSFSIIILYCLFSKLRAYCYKIIFKIALADALHAIFFVLPRYFEPSQDTCVCYAIAFHSTAMISILWSLSIALDIYYAVTKKNLGFNRYYRCWLIINYILVPIINSAPTITKSYGLTDKLCTYKSNYYGNIWRFSLFYIPLWVLTLFIICLYVNIYIKVRKLELEHELMEFLKRFMLYPIVLIISLGPCRTQNFYIISLAIYTLHGFFNSVVYGFNPQVKEAIRGSLFRKVSVSEGVRFDRVNSSTSEVVLLDSNDFEIVYPEK